MTEVRLQEPGFLFWGNGIAATVDPDEPPLALTAPPDPLLVPPDPVAFAPPDPLPPLPMFVPGAAAHAASPTRTDSATNRDIIEVKYAPACKVLRC